MYNHMLRLGFSGSGQGCAVDFAMNCSFEGSNQQVERCAYPCFHILLVWASQIHGEIAMCGVKLWQCFSICGRKTAAAQFSVRQENR
jgi:hypothetical protein